MEDYLNVYVHALASYRGVNEEEVEGWLIFHGSDAMKYRVTQKVSDLGWVDLGFGTFPG